MAEPAHENTLPDIADITQEQVNKFWDIWITYRAYDRKFPPSMIAGEPHEMTRVITNLDYMFSIIEETVMKEKAEEEKRKQEMNNVS